jgi:hypothetical protein
MNRPRVVYFSSGATKCQRTAQHGMQPTARTIASALRLMPDVRWIKNEYDHDEPD